MEVEVVIVGAGIAGLATAVALRRLGAARSLLVLERHLELRAAGAAITLFPNAWCALRALGVAHKLTSRYDSFQISRVTTLETGTTQEFHFVGHKDRAGVGVRAVHRRALLEALAEELPPGTVRFSSKIVSIKHETAQADASETAILLLEDGALIRAKVVIGCDGVHSVVAQWLGMSEPAPSGRSCVRALAVYPDGHGLKNELRQYLSDGLRCGFLPISATDIYWFLVNNTIPAEQEIGKNPALILQEVTGNLARELLGEYLDVVRHSDPATVTWAPLLFRPPWDILTGRASRGPVTVAGDAFHPMTPDLAQGGCSALEDGVVLARALSRASTPSEGVSAYLRERRGRAAWLVAGAYLSGWVQQGGTHLQGVRASMVKWFRDWIFYPFVFPRLADSMWYDCGDLI